MSYSQSIREEAAVFVGVQLGPKSRPWQKLLDQLGALPPGDFETLEVGYDDPMLLYGVRVPLSWKEARVANVDAAAIQDAFMQVHERLAEVGHDAHQIDPLPVLKVVRRGR